MKTFNLTENETRVALILVKSCLEGMGGDRPSDLEHDTYTWVNADDLIEAGYSRHEAAGYFSSLMDKGIIAGESAPKGEPVETFLTDDAWRFLDTIWDDEKSMMMMLTDNG